MSLEGYCLKPSPSSQVKAIDNQRKITSFSQKAILTTEFYSKNSAKSLRLQKEVPISTKGIFLSLELCAPCFTSVTISSTGFAVFAGAQRLLSCLGKFFEETVQLQTSAPARCHHTLSAYLTFIHSIQKIKNKKYKIKNIK